MPDLCSPSSQGHIELVIKKSRFIGWVIPVTHPNDMQTFLSQLQQQHPKARHICSGFRIGHHNITEGFSDDGEPKGTAGMPILKVLQHNQLSNCAVFIVRYFGGIKLGTGGLQRAYSDSTAQAIQSIELIPMIDMLQIQIECSHHHEGSIRHQLVRASGEIIATHYVGDQAVQIQFVIQIPATHLELWQRWCSERNLKLLTDQ